MAGGVPDSMLNATIEALRRHAPYDRMDRESLVFLVGQLGLAYYAKGAVVAAPDQGMLMNAVLKCNCNIRNCYERSITGQSTGRSVH